MGTSFVVGWGSVVCGILVPSETILSDIEISSPSKTMLLVLSDPVGSSYSRNNVCCFSRTCSELFSRREIQLGGGVDDCRYGTVENLSSNTT